MSGDYSRRRFEKRMDFSAVLNQQGRVQLDSDWNELNEIHSRRLRTETVGTMGRAVVPTEGGKNANAFKITLDNGILNIGAGRIYVDGLLAENHGDLSNTIEFDAVLEEEKATQPIPYDKQPYLPNAPTVAPLPTGGLHAVYLDVWQREVTYLEHSGLVENAVGVDTTTRMQTAWQVKLKKLDGLGTCDSLPEALTKPSMGRLSTKAVGVATATDPCKVPPTGGYRGLDNRLYRVEIHDGGATGVATFKWSHDNASMAVAVTAISADRKSITVDAIGRDSVMRFAIDDWVEVTEDWFELASQPGLDHWEKTGGGVMARISNIHSDTLVIELVDPLPLSPQLPANVLPSGNLERKRHTRVRRWDQRGKIHDINGKLLIDLNAAPSPGFSSGVIPVPAKGTSIILEDGIQITFETADSDEYHVADYWNFVARTADASVEELRQAPPRGVHHHFCQLALVTMTPQSTPDDCRTFWPPTFGGASCECTVCVSSEQFDKDKSSIQRGINSLKKAGGKLCLGPGIFALDETVVLNNGLVSIHVSGRGQSTVIIQPKERPAFRIGVSSDGSDAPLNMTGGTTIEDLQVWTQPQISTGGPGLSGPAFDVTNVFDFMIQRCWVTPLPMADKALVVPTDPAIVLNGVIINATVRDNSLIASYGITTSLSKTFLTNLRVQNNNILAWADTNTPASFRSAGIDLTNSFTFESVSISCNSIFVGPGNTFPTTAAAQSVYIGIALPTMGGLESRIEINTNHIVVSMPSPCLGVIGIGEFPNRDAVTFLPPITRIAENDIFLKWVGGSALGIAIQNIAAFNQIRIEGNSIQGLLTTTQIAAPGNAAWAGLIMDSDGPNPQELCGITANMIEVRAEGATSYKYQGVEVKINGGCIFSENHIVNNNPLATPAKNSEGDVQIESDVTVAGNNFVMNAAKGTVTFTPVSIALKPRKIINEVGVATVLGNICSGPIRVNGNPPSTQLNITQA